MAQERIEIIFKPTGNVPLVKAIKELHKATQKLNGQLKILNVTNVKVAKTQALVTQRVSSNTTALAVNSSAYTKLQSVISVYRNKMLLAAFATALVIKPMLRIVKLSGDLEEVMNKANVVFGKNSQIVGRWAEALGSSIGRAKSSLVEMASGLQDTFVPLGFTREAATKLSTSLTALAIDVGSFSNKLDADVIRDFQSAIVGNHETVRKYGIIITEALLEQEAFNLGITESERVLTAQEKVQARVSLITKGSSDAIGDAEKTAGSYTNTVKKLSSTWLEMGQDLGEALKPLIKFGAIILANKRVIRTFGLLLGGLSVAFAVVKVQAIMASMAVGSFKRALIKSGIGVVVVLLGALAEKFLFLDEKAGEAGDTVEDLNKIMEDNITAIMRDTEAQKKHTISVEDSKDALIRNYIAMGVNSTAAVYSREVNRSLTREERNIIDLIDEKTLSLERSAEAQKLIQKGFSLAVSSQKEKIQSDIEAIELEQKRAESIIIAQHGLDGYNILMEAAANIGKSFEFFGQNSDAMNKSIQTLLDGNVAIREYVKLIAKIDIENEHTEALFEITGKVGDRISVNLTLKEKELIIDAEANTLLKERNAGLISEAEYQLALFDIEKKRLALEQSRTELIVDNVGRIADNVSEMVDIYASGIQRQLDARDAAADAEINTLKKSRKYQKMSVKQQADEEQKIRDDAEKDKAKKAKKANALKLAMFRVDQVLRISEAVMGTAKEVASHSGNPLMAAFAAAVGAMQITTIAAQSPPPKMAKGGLIGGRSHSQGGTLIEAEKGEFVMSRNAVDTIGAENLNRMNRGGGGSTNISFSGNILSDDFIESEAIPKIKEAIRRGADIGIG